MDLRRFLIETGILDADDTLNREDGPGIFKLGLPDGTTIDIASAVDNGDEIVLHTAR